VCSVGTSESGLQVDGSSPTTTRGACALVLSNSLEGKVDESGKGRNLREVEPTADPRDQQLHPVDFPR